MVLSGKVSIELGIRSSGDKFFNLFLNQLHHVQNLSERVHGTKLHQGDWHNIGCESVKHWTYVIDGKVTTCKEHIEAIDEPNKTITYKLFEGDVSQHYKDFKLIFQVIDKNDGSAAIKWTIEYEKVNEDIEPPYGYMEYVNKVTKDIDNYLLKA